MNPTDEPTRSLKTNDQEPSDTQTPAQKFKPCHAGCLETHPEQKVEEEEQVFDALVHCHAVFSALFLLSGFSLSAGC